MTHPQPLSIFSSIRSSCSLNEICISCGPLPYCAATSCWLAFLYCYSMSVIIWFNFASQDWAMESLLSIFVRVSLDVCKQLTWNMFVEWNLWTLGLDTWSAFHSHRMKDSWCTCVHGMADTYRKLCLFFVAEPLIRLVGKEVKFEWCAIYNQTFQDLNLMLTSAPLFKH